MVKKPKEEIMSEKRLYKSRNKMLCGVCGGVAEYFSVDPTLIRLAVVFLSVAGVGSGLLAYIIAAIIMPEKPGDMD
jgi:phage shock protein PspC (stress-responsive transcriptional regulator)